MTEVDLEVETEEITAVAVVVAEEITVVVAVAEEDNSSH